MIRVALVLGAAVWPDGSASPTLRLRTLHAVGLWKSGRVDTLCLTGGLGRHGPTEAAVAAELAMRAGVPESALILEDQSTSTVDNLAFARPLLPEGATILIVTNRWHLPRAWLAARILGLRVAADCPRGTMGRSKAARAVLREAAAIPMTAARAIRVRWARRSAQ